MSDFVLYRIYDCEGSLLYIGQTTNLKARIKQHRKYQTWADEIHNIIEESKSDYQELLIAEKEAIQNEQPKYNKIRFNANKQPEIDLITFGEDFDVNQTITAMQGIVDVWPEPTGASRALTLKLRLGIERLKRGGNNSEILSDLNQIAKQ